MSGQHEASAATDPMIAVVTLALLMLLVIVLALAA